MVRVREGSSDVRAVMRERARFYLLLLVALVRDTDILLLQRLISIQRRAVGQAILDRLHQERVGVVHAEDRVPLARLLGRAQYAVRHLLHRKPRLHKAPEARDVIVVE